MPGIQTNRNMHKAEDAVASAAYEVHRLRTLARLFGTTSQLDQALTKARRKEAATHRRLVRLRAQRALARRRKRLKVKIAALKGAGARHKLKPCVTCPVGLLLKPQG